MNSDRDNVTPAYLREVRTHVLNEMHARLPDDDAAMPSVMDALPKVSPEAVESILTKQYGERRAIYDPSDPEANRTLQSQGFNIISGRAFTKDAWKNIRESGAAKPAGQLAPTYKPYSPDGDPANFIPESEWTPALRDIANYARLLGKYVLEKAIEVRFEKGRLTAPFIANYGSRVLTFNYDRLGAEWFGAGRRSTKVNRLIIHELAHEYGGHLTEAFDDALAQIGARMIELAFTHPSIFESGYAE